VDVSNLCVSVFFLPTATGGTISIRWCLALVILHLLLLHIATASSVAEDTAAAPSGVFRNLGHESDDDDFVIGWETSTDKDPLSSSPSLALSLREGETMAATRVTKDRVCIVGSGNWGSAISIIIGQNCAALPHWFENKVKIWVFEEEVEHHGELYKLSALINAQHENTKYLPGIRLPENVVAEPNLEEACRDATVLVFVLPHQFLPKLLPRIRKVVDRNCRCVSLIKGLGTFFSDSHTC
jgi:hypothetical protein